MNELDIEVRTALDGWRVESTDPAWSDVLARAGVRRTIRPHAASVAALAVVLGLLLSIPAFGVGGRLTQLITGAKRPGIGFKTTIATSSGTTVGTFTLHTNPLLVRIARPAQPRPLPVWRPGRLPASTARWTLELDRPATEARLERVLLRSKRHVLVARLCAPCSGKVDGRVRLRRGAFGALFGRRLVVVVRSPSGTASGVLRVVPPRR